MGKRILLVQGHPDGSARHLCHELAATYAQGAARGGHETRILEIASLDFPVLRSQRDWEQGPVPQGLQQAQEDIRWAEHIVFFFPLWLGDMPALVKAFLEQVARPQFAFEYGEGGSKFTHKGLKGRSARVVVTMGMPALIYRWYFRAHSVRALERNVLGFVGMSPVHETLIGSVAHLDAKQAGRWFARMRKLGAAAA